MEARQELDKHVAIKRERETICKHQKEIEFKLQQQTDEAIKRSDENIEKAKQIEIRRQKDFFRVGCFA